MIVTLFRSRLRADVDAGFEEDAAAIEVLARSMPGFVSFETFTDAGGDRMSIIAFESDEAHRVWREHPEHRAAQKRGRERYYETYDIQVMSLIRKNTFDRSLPVS